MKGEGEWKGREDFFRSVSEEVEKWDEREKKMGGGEGEKVGQGEFFPLTSEEGGVGMGRGMGGEGEKYTEKVKGVSKKFKRQGGEGVEVVWHSDVDSLPNSPCLVVGHEFYDALPVHKLYFTKERGWVDVLVDHVREEGGGEGEEGEREEFRFVLSPHKSAVASFCGNILPAYKDCKEVGRGEREREEGSSFFFPHILNCIFYSKKNNNHNNNRDKLLKSTLSHYPFTPKSLNTLAKKKDWLFISIMGVLNHIQTV